MKKLLFIAVLSLVSVFCISATVANHDSAESCTSSTTVSISGLDEDITFDVSILTTIYNIMPQRVKDLCVDSYADIASRIETSNKSFTYEGVKITPIKSNGQTNLKFSYGGYSVLVENYTKAKFDSIFGM